MTRKRFVTGNTIDGPKANILEDAIYVRKHNNGRTEILFSISCPVATLRPRSQAIQDIKERILVNLFSREGSYPSFLKKSLKDKHSLSRMNPPVPVLTVKVVFNPDLTLAHTKVSEGLFKNLNKFSFAGFNQAIKSVHTPSINEDYRFYLTLAQRLQKKSYPELPEITDSISMLRFYVTLANIYLTRFCIEKSIPILFFNGSLPSWSFKNRSLQYSPEVHMHYILDAVPYATWTSPMRKPADFFNQAQIIAHLRGQSAPLSGYALRALAEPCGVYEHQESSFFKKLQEKEERLELSMRRLALLRQKNWELEFLKEHKISNLKDFCVHDE